jgi:outer membrane biogenesis lipoprotein LolB
MARKRCAILFLAIVSVLLLSGCATGAKPATGTLPTTKPSPSQQISPQTSQHDLQSADAAFNTPGNVQTLFAIMEKDANGWKLDSLGTGLCGHEVAPTGRDLDYLPAPVSIC